MSTVAALDTYFTEIQRKSRQPESREHAYRPALQGLLESLSDFEAINDAARIKGVGAPDFIIKRGDVRVAFVEAKDVGEDLSRIERTSQFKGYREALPNLLLTDYLEFRWYYEGEHRLTARLAEISRGKLNKDEAGVWKVAQLLDQFAAAQTPTVRSAEELARHMAGMARKIAELIENTLPDTPDLQAQKQAFEETLIPNLTARQFADMYAQTLAYGLFSARVTFSEKHPGKDPKKEFTLHNAFFDLPDTNPFLKDLFQNVARKLSEGVSWLVETLTSLLAHADTDKILEGFGKKTRQEDPVVHFYETFLSAYDPAQRERRGVYYTPEPVVSYIVRSVDHVLKTRFNRPDGLANKDTLILDPATGTGTFLYFVIQHIYEQIVQIGGQRGSWNSYVRDQLLPRIFGFELLMAPYAVAHMKLGIQLQTTGYKFTSGGRLNVFLTNTLEEQVKANQSDLGFSGFIADEANKALAVKRDQPIMVVFGNPPYSGHSANTGTWIRDLVRDYYQVDGKPLGERNPKWLQDDYVKFIRFGQWRIDTTKSGVLAFVTNHGYLDNPTFRGMRQQLMQSFDEIYVLDLHGNSKKREKTPEGGVDQNVFDIQQGVAIGIFIKHPKTAATISHPERRGKVYHADLYGLRAEKYEALYQLDLSSVKWSEFNPQSPYYLFTPQNLDLQAEYDLGWKVTEVFGTGNTQADSGNVYALGIVTHNDLLHIGWSFDEVKTRIAKLADSNLSDSDVLRQLPIQESRYWNTAREREKVRQSNWSANIWRIYYRPFDWRHIYYEPSLMEIGRGGASKKVMTRAKNSSLNLMVSRGYEIDGFEHVLVADAVAVHHAATRKEGNYFFPLYLYPDPNENTLFSTLPGDWPRGENGRTPNLNPKFVKDMESRLGLTFQPHPEMNSVMGGVIRTLYLKPLSPEYRVLSTLHPKTSSITPTRSSTAQPTASVTPNFSKSTFPACRSPRMLTYSAPSAA